MAKKIDKTRKKQSKGGNPKWKKGIKSPNPKGRPKGSDYMSQLKEAIKVVEKEKGKKLLTRFIEMAWHNPSAMIGLMKKILPDKSQSDVTVTSIYDEYEKMTDQELVNQANEILKRAGPFNINKDVN